VIGFELLYLCGVVEKTGSLLKTPLSLHSPHHAPQMDLLKYASFPAADYQMLRIPLFSLTCIFSLGVDLSPFHPDVSLKNGRGVRIDGFYIPGCVPPSVMGTSMFSCTGIK
jgi:hypothetical protein